MDREMDYMSIKNVDALFNSPELVKPDRKPDFIIDDTKDKHWPTRSLYYIPERIQVFEDHTENDESLVRLLIDERYGIFADTTYHQTLRGSWDLQSKEVHELYANWLATKELL